MQTPKSNDHWLETKLLSRFPGTVFAAQSLVSNAVGVIAFLATIFGATIFGAVNGQGQEIQASKTPTQMAARVDQLLNEHLQEIGWQAAGNCTDSALLRRIYLDLTGMPPAASEVLDYLDDKAVDKREKLVAKLLNSPNCASHFADTWSAWMLPEDSNPLVQNGQNGLHAWLRDRFIENLRYDRLVADLLVSSGPIQSGPAAFFVALEGKPEKIAAKTARVFLGVQLDCAQCHDHPFDSWSQKDFWGFAAYFAQMSTNNEDGAMMASEVADIETGDVKLPGTEDVIGPKPLVATGFSGLSRGTRRQQLTLWLTARENPFLARATVNRVWAMLFGRGLIEPVDDMRSLQMASHPKLLEELSDYFADSGYDLRNLIGTLTRTDAYRRNTKHPSGQAPESSYAVMATKPLTEQQMANSLAQVARQIGGDEATRAALASQLGKLRGDASEAKLGIVSALVTLHGSAFDRVSSESTSRLLKALEAPHLDQRKQLRWLFLSTLNRLPSREEEIAFSDMLGATTTRSGETSPQSDGSSGGIHAETNRDAKGDGNSDYAAHRTTETWQSDLLWALINSSEFAMTP